MKVGNLRHSVVYQGLSQGTPSPYGDSAQVWTALARKFADVEYLDGEKLMRARAVHEQAKAQITLRYDPIITSNGRFVFGGENFYPASIIPDAQKTKLTCICYVRPQENVS